MVSYKRSLLADAYAAEWIPGRANSENCSGFLKSAARALGAEVPDGNADTIIERLEQLSGERNAPWRLVGTGPVGLQAAIREAAAGRLVVAAMTSRDAGHRHGHVAILLPELEGPHQAPLVFGGGSEAARSTGNRTIRDVWRPSSHSKLRFFVHATARLAAEARIDQPVGSAAAARRLLALSFYRRFCPDRLGEVDYIDLSYPVREVRVTRGERLWGHKDPRVSPLRATFFTRPGTPVEILGVHPFGDLRSNPRILAKVCHEYEVLVDVPVALESVCARGLDTWSLSGRTIPVSGGGWQVKVPRPEVHLRWIARAGDGS